MPRLLPRIARRERRLVFQLTVSSSDENRDLRPGSSIGDYPAGTLEVDLRDILSRHLPEEFDRIFGIHAETKILDVRYGSLTAFFAVILSGLGVVATYKDLVDSVLLIRDHCTLLVESLIERKYGDNYNVHVSALYPRVDHDWPWQMFFERRSGAIGRCGALWDTRLKRRLSPPGTAVSFGSL